MGDITPSLHLHYEVAPVLPLLLFVVYLNLGIVVVKAAGPPLPRMEKLYLDSGLQAGLR